MSIKSATGQVLDIRLKWGWSIGSLGTMTMYYLVNTTILYFMTDYLAISPAVAAMIILSSRLYDLVGDMVIGLLSDRTVSRWGRRRPWLIGGGVVSSLACLMLFAGPPIHGAGLVAYMAIAFAVYFTGYTAFNIPYLSMPAEMTDDYHDRTVLMSYRTFFTSVAGVVATGLSPLLIKLFGGGREGFRGMAVVMAVIVLATALVCFLGTAGARHTTRETSRPMTRQVWLRSITDNRPFMDLMLIKLFQLFASGITFAMMYYLAVHVYGRGEVGVFYFGVPMYIATGLSIPVWTWLAARFEKNVVFLMSTTGKIIVISTFVFITPAEPIILFVLRTAAFGFFTGGMILMGQSMLPDAIEYDFRTTGMRREGVFASLYSFVEKSSAALVPVAVGLVLSAGGYVKGLQGGAQPQSAITAIFIGAIVLPVLGYAASVPFLLRYSLSSKAMRALREGPPATPGPAVTEALMSPIEQAG